MKRLAEYKQYHYEMLRIGDCDPQYPALCYLADRFELNIEQRYWLAFLFSCCYAVPTVYYMYNEFPDYSTVNVNRLQRWWTQNKALCLFQTDRLRIKTGDQFVPTFQSYASVVGPSQAIKFQSFRRTSAVATYQAAYEEMNKVKNFGRFTMFLYLEAVARLTGFNMIPQGLDIRNSKSSRNGLLYVLGLDDLIDTEPPKSTCLALERQFQALVTHLRANSRIKQHTDVWNTETTLCAFKKLVRGTRYLGYYINRQADEITTMQQRVVSGVDWSVLWDHRAEHFQPQWLREKNETHRDRRGTSDRKNHDSEAGPDVSREGTGV